MTGKCMVSTIFSYQSEVLTATARSQDDGLTPVDKEETSYNTTAATKLSCGLKSEVGKETPNNDN